MYLFVSDKLQSNSGVPQSLILGTLLFLIFVNDIHENIQSDIKLFADDTTLLYSYDASSMTCKVLNENLQQINIWAKKWYRYVKFNPTKSVVLTLDSKQIQPQKKIMLICKKLIATGAARNKKGGGNNFFH